MGREDRGYWADTLVRIAFPVLDALANERLKATMPVEVAHPLDRAHVTHLEAFGRTLAGIAPWLEAPHLDADEAPQRDEIAALARRSLRAACDPASADVLNFSVDRQPLVDAAFLAYGILRAPRALWDDLDGETQSLVIAALKQTRRIRPNNNNWLLFAAMIETLLERGAGEGDLLRIDYALREHQQWYLGDGIYGDGPFFHWDYYNSYVIQPMLLDILATLRGRHDDWDRWADLARERAQRYAVIQERLIAPDGTFPVIGRSLCYRAGAFQLLAQMALRRDLPEGLPPAQVRCALTAVIRRTMDAPGTFDARGWLTLGLSGHQPGLAEPYISTGSLYLCTVGFLPLGLPPDDPFWVDEDMPWTARRVWSGEDLPADHAYDRGVLSVNPGVWSES
jgi:hypothetical protein